MSSRAPGPIRLARFVPTFQQNYRFVTFDRSGVQQIDGNHHGIAGTQNHFAFRIADLQPSGKHRVFSNDGMRVPAGIRSRRIVPDDDLIVFLFQAVAKIRFVQFTRSWVPRFHFQHDGRPPIFLATPSRHAPESRAVGTSALPWRDTPRSPGTTAMDSRNSPLRLSRHRDRFRPCSVPIAYPPSPPDRKSAAHDTRGGCRWSTVARRKSIPRTDPGPIPWWPIPCPGLRPSRG